MKNNFQALENTHRQNQSPLRAYRGQVDNWEFHHVLYCHVLHLQNEMSHHCQQRLFGLYGRGTGCGGWVGDSLGDLKHFQ